MPNMADYLDGKGAARLEAEAEPTGERPFAVGTVVVVDRICDVDPEDYPDSFPAVVKIREVGYGGGARASHTHDYVAYFPGRSYTWCFSDEECRPYDGVVNEDDLPMLLEDAQESGGDTTRPTVGDLVIVREMEDLDEIDPMPQVVLIKQDDHDSTPYLADFLLHDGDISEDLWFAECEMYRGPLTADQAPFVLAE